MSPIGHMFKLLFVDMGPMGPVLLLLLALGSMWLGYRFSTLGWSALNSATSSAKVFRGLTIQSARTCPRTSMNEGVYGGARRCSTVRFRRRSGTPHGGGGET